MASLRNTVSGRGDPKNHTGPDHYADSGFEQAFQGGHGVDRFGYSMKRRDIATILDRIGPFLWRIGRESPYDPSR